MITTILSCPVIHNTYCRSLHDQWSLRTRRSGGPLLVVWGTVSCWREIGCASPWFVFPPASAIKKLELYKISFFLFELMPDFKSFEHKLWVFWQNVKIKKKCQEIYIIWQECLIHWKVFVNERWHLFQQGKSKEYAPYHTFCKSGSLSYQLTFFYLNKGNICQQTVKALSAGLKEWVCLMIHSVKVFLLPTAVINSWAESVQKIWST